MFNHTTKPLSIHPSKHVVFNWSRITENFDINRLSPVERTDLVA